VISDVLVFIAKDLIGYRKKIIIKNLRKAFPGSTEQELQLLLPGIYRNLTDVMIETFKLLTISREELNRRIQIINIDIPNQYYRGEKSIIITTSHNCNWEWMLGATSINLSAPIDAVYQHIKSSFFEKMMFQIRSRFGAIPVEKNNVFRENLKKRNLSHIVALVADQSPPHGDKNVYWTKFLNQETAFYNGMERLAIGFNWPVIHARMKRLKRGFYEIEFVELEPEPANAQPGSILEKYAEILEGLIKENPTDWLWSHNRWKRKKHD
jgi:KDO2-lipid IV(A) lauroyltransferase